MVTRAELVVGRNGTSQEREKLSRGAPKGIDAAQAAYWEEAFTKVVHSEALNKDIALNYWTIDPIGARELPAFLEKEYQDYRKSLLSVGMAK